MSTNWFSIGHTTHAADRTGCTVILFSELVPAAVDVRGGAPGTRETTLLDPSRRGLVDAIAFSGGSAFGLGVADGVMRYLSERGRGYQTPAGPVPLVPAAIVFDLMNGNPIAPSADDGYVAASNASFEDISTGQVGAGAGVTVAKLSGHPQPAGLGIASSDSAYGTATAIIVLNAIGDIRDPENGRYLARAADGSGSGRSGRDLLLNGGFRAREGEHTTIGAVLVSAPMDTYGLQRICIAAHDALARCVVPAHTVYDGDTFFAAAPTSKDANQVHIPTLSAAAEIAVEAAIISIFK